MDEVIRIFQTTNKYDLENGHELVIHSPGVITYKMTILEKHLSSPDTAHGGVIAGFMDCVLGVAALSEAVHTQNLTSTVEFKINYIRPVKLGEEIIGSGKVIHRGKSLIISSGEIRNAKTQELVAMGQGTFNTYPITKKEWINEYKNAGK